MPVSSNLGICYEATQRIYRSGVIRYIRSKFAAAYPSRRQITHHLRSAVGNEQWIKIEIRMKERRRTGEVSTAVKDDFDYLGVNHFYNLLEKHFDLLFPVVLMQTGNPGVARNRQSLAGVKERSSSPVGFRSSTYGGA
jgi:hypothetical protein